MSILKLMPSSGWSSGAAPGHGASQERHPVCRLGLWTRGLGSVLKRQSSPSWEGETAKLLGSRHALWTGFGDIWDMTGALEPGAGPGAGQEGPCTPHPVTAGQVGPGHSRPEAIRRWGPGSPSSRRRNLQLWSQTFSFSGVTWTSSCPPWPHLCWLSGREQLVRLWGFMGPGSQVPITELGTRWAPPTPSPSPAGQVNLHGRSALVRLRACMFYLTFRLIFFIF